MRWLALAAIAVAGCTDAPVDFELRVDISVQPPDALEAGQGNLAFHFKTAAAAVADPPVVTIFDGAGPHDFPIAFNCAFAGSLVEDPIEVEVVATLSRDAGALQLSRFTRSCGYENGVIVLSGVP